MSQTGPNNPSRHQNQTLGCRNGKPDPLRYPTLFVGLGGTGVLTLRFLKTIAKKGNDPALTAALENGSLQLLGIDTDHGSNRIGRKVDRRMRPHPLDDSTVDYLPYSELEQLENFITINAQDISKALLSTQASVRQLNGNAGDDLKKMPIKHREIAEWFPQGSGEGEEISYGQSKQAGAAQWRALGRMGLFLHASTIYSKLQSLNKRITDAMATDANLDGIPRAYVVSSLAGGTGSGMFWDIGFMLRSLNDHLIINSAFLLPDAFEELDRARRIFPNAYAALKELAYLKNWTWKKSYRFDWPGAGHFDVHQNGKTAFDTVYLYRDFKPSPHAEDVSKARVDLSCMRIAENMLAQIRTDIHTELDQGANNESGDTTAHSGDPEAKYVFSTSGTVRFEIPSLKDFYERIWQTQLQTFKEHLATDKPQLEIEDEDLKNIFGYPLDKGRSQPLSRLAQHLGNALPVEPMQIEQWRDHLESDSVETELKRLDEAVLRRAQAGSDAEAKRSEQAEFIELRNAYEAIVPKGIRESWQEAHIDDPDQEHPHFLKSTQIYHADLDSVIGKVTQKIQSLTETMKKEGWMLNQHQWVILDELKKAITVVSAANPSESDAPVSGSDRKVALESEAVALTKNQATEFPPPGQLYALAPDLFDKDDKGLSRTANMLVQIGSFPVVKHLPRAQPAIQRDLLPEAIASFKDLLDVLRTNLKRQREFTEQERKDIMTHALRHSAQGQALQTALAALLEQHKTNEIGRRNFIDVICNDRHYPPLNERNSERKARLKIVRTVLDSIFENLLGALQTEDDRFELAEKASDRWRFQRETLSYDAKQLLSTRIGPDQTDESDFSRSRRGGNGAFIPSLHDPKHQDGSPPPGVQFSQFWERFLRNLKASQDNDTPDMRLYNTIQTTLGINTADTITNKKQREALLDGWRAINISVLDLLFSHRGGVLARMGGTSTLARQLKQCDSNVFETGALSNSGAKRNLVVVKSPDERLIPSLDVRKEQGRQSEDPDKQLDEILQSESQGYFRTDPRVVTEGSTFPIIYYEELSRSAEELGPVHRYREAYLERPASYRALYHLFRGINELDDVVTSPIPGHAILCGNDQCEFDLRHYPRTLTVCPGCKNPIWNRCGNSNCTEDQLLDRLKHSYGGKLPKPLPIHECPECNQDMKTYWWTCPDHPETGIPTDKKQCPRCLAEHQQGTRDYRSVQRRPDLTDLECPGCLSLPISAEEHTHVPSELIPYYEKGVNGHDSTRFPELIKLAKLKPHVCTQHNHVHMLFPTCPEKNERGEYHHLFLNESNNRFICPEHPQKQFYTCAHCDYPIDSEAVHSGSTTECPRCLRELHHCDFCSDHYNKLYQPTRDNKDNRPHCPTCGNNISAQPGNKTKDINEDFRRPGYCRNHFECDAAVKIWNTSTDFEMESCQVCENPKATLLNRRQLVRNIERCPVCMSLHGLPEGNNAPAPIGGLVPYLHGASPERRTSCRGDALFEKIKLVDPDQWDPFRDCPHCGTQPISMLFWSLLDADRAGKQNDCNEDGNDQKDGISSTAPIVLASDRIKEELNLEWDIWRLPPKKKLRMPPYEELNFEDALRVFSILMQEKNDVLALELFKDQPFYHRYRENLDDITLTLLPIIAPGSLAATSFEKRMNAISTLAQDELLRE